MTPADAAPRRGGMARNVLHLGLGQATTLIVTILLNAMLARTLGPYDFGLLYLVMQIATFAYVIIEWGHGPYIIRETARHPERSGELTGSAFAVRSACALIACAIAAASTWLLGYDLRTQLLTGALIVFWLPQYLGLSIGWVFRGYERMDLDALLNVVLKLATLIGSVACLLLTHDLLPLLLVWCAAGCLTLAIAVYFYRSLGLPRIFATLSTARELLRDGAAFLGISLAVALESYFNANILFKMASPEVVGWYGAASTIFGSLIAPASILGATLYPRWAKSAGDEVEFKRQFDMSLRPLLVIAVLGAVGTYLFADVAVGLIYSMKTFAPAADNLRAFAPVVLLMYIDIFMSMAILAVGKAAKLALAKVVAVVVTTALVFVLVPLCQARFANGGLGIMGAMMVGELFMLTTAGILLRKAVDARTMVHACRSLIAGVATVLLFRWLPPLTPILAIPLCVIMFAGLSWLFRAVKRSDVEVLRESFRKRPPESR